MDWLLYEKEAISKGYANVCGVDEAGRGPLAGPVYAAAVILPPGLEIEGVNDSKKLTEKKREALFPEIKEKALAYCIASASEKEIDKLNILNATYLAMARAVEGLPVKADYALIDGNRMPRLPIPGETIVKRGRTFYEHCLRLHFSQGNPGSCYDGMGSKVSPVPVRQA